jgi:hypothetical protein
MGSGAVFRLDGWIDRNRVTPRQTIAMTLVSRVSAGCRSFANAESLSWQQLSTQAERCV